MLLSDLLPFVLPDAKGCPDMVATFQIRLAIIELCRESLVWCEYQPEITTADSVIDYAYAPAAGQVIVKVLSAKLDSCDLPLIDPAKAARSTGMFANGSASGIRLSRPPTAGSKLVTYSAVMPSLSADNFPDSLSRYAEAIGRGALYRLKNTKGRDYSEPAGAATLYRLWQDDINDARSEAFLGLTRNAPRTTLQLM